MLIHSVTLFGIKNWPLKTVKIDLKMQANTLWARQKCKYIHTGYNMLIT